MKRAFADSGGIEDLYPLTPMQEGMLFHALADPEAGHYVEQFVCRLRGELDPSALQESWNRLVARHPALRSTIHWIDFDRPYQVVHRRADHPVEYQDWRGLTPAEQDAASRGLSRLGPPARIRSLAASVVAADRRSGSERMCINSSGASIMP